MRLKTITIRLQSCLSGGLDPGGALGFGWIAQ